MLKKCLLFIFLVQICTTTAQQSQKKIDSLLNLVNSTENDTIKADHYLKLSGLTMYNDSKKTLEYIENANVLYKKTNSDRGVAKLYAQKANYFYRQGKLDSARHYLSNSVDKSIFLGDTLKAAIIRHNIGILDAYQGDLKSASNLTDTNIEIYKEYQDTLQLSTAYLFKGSLAKQRGHYNIALKQTYNALKTLRSLKNDFRIAEGLFQLGQIYELLKEDKKAIESYNESISFYEKKESKQSIAQVLTYRGFAKINLFLLDDATKDLKEALALSEELNYNANIARCYYDLGLVEYTKENYSAAINYFKTSIEKWQKIGSPGNEADSYLYLGRSYSKLKQYKKALTYFDKSIKIGNSINSPSLLKSNYLEKYDVLEKTNNFKTALINLKKGKTINDSIFTLEQSKATEELKIIHETEKKEQKIVLQENEINLLEQKAKVSTLQKWFLGSGLTLSLIAIGFGFYGFRQKIKRNKAEKEKLDNELDHKKKQLTTHALHLAKKNEVLENLKSKAQEFKNSEENSKGFQQLIRTINFDLQDDKNWENFSKYFEEVHQGFSKKAQQKFPNITSNDLRLMALLKMNLSSREIANILSISNEGIKKARYRLRKKLSLSTEDSLEDFILSF